MRSGAFICYHRRPISLLVHPKQKTWRPCLQPVAIQATLTVLLADRCNTTFGYCHEMSSVCLSSVTRVYCGQRVGRIKMKLGMQVGLGPGHIVLHGNPAPPPLNGHSPPPNFRPISVADKWLHASRCHLVWSKDSAQATLCWMGTPFLLPKRGRSTQIFGPSIVAKRLHGSGCLVVCRQALAQVTLY